ncbi:APC family permease [Streptomyces sp. enrichment culture]|uniref:APC family permease n=1 Tax=Streptomyces sp. enrichment culture TaxID=1795815 RepID=UPI003F553A2C
MAVAAITPLSTLSSNLSLSLAFGVGPATVLVILLVMLMAVLFTAGYVVLTRSVVDSGANSAYVAHGLGPVTGSAAAVVSTIGYNLAVVAFAGISGYFLDSGFSAGGLEGVPWWGYTLAVLAVIGTLGHLGVRAASRVTSVVCVAQFLLLGLFVGAVVLQNPSGFRRDVITSGDAHGGAFALSLVFVLLALTSYESPATYGEEARDPHRSVPRAIYLTLFVVTAVFVIGTWTMLAAIDERTAVLARTDPGQLLPHLFETYLGGWAGVSLNLVVAISMISAALAFHNLATRYMFSSARAGLFPAALTRTHSRRRTPHVAAVTQLLVTVAVLAPFAVTGEDPLVGLFPAVAGYNALMLILMQAALSVSVIAAASRGRVTGSVYATRVAPALVLLAALPIGALIISHYAEVTGSDAAWVNWMPLLIVVGGAYGALRRRRLRRRPGPDHAAQHATDAGVAPECPPPATTRPA